MTYPFFLFFTLLSADGQTDQYALFEDMQFDKAREALSKSVISLKNLHLASLNDCADLILNEGDEKFQLLEEDYFKRLKALDQLPENAGKNFVASEIRLHWAFIAGKYGENWTAFWTLRKALRIINKNIDEYPHYQPNLRTIGLLNIVLDLVPENRKWLLNVFGMKGDFELGYSQLSQVHESENEIILSLINTYVLEKEVSTQFYKDKAIYHYLAGLINNKQHKAKEAINSFNQINSELLVQPYLLAESYFNNGNYATSIEYYLSFLDKPEFINYKKDATLKLALAYWFGENNIPLSEAYLEKAKGIEQSETEIDRNAAQLIDKVEESNKDLLMLRFILDGGNFQKAAELIALIESTSLTAYQQLEFNYRKARFYQLTKDLEQSIKYFQFVIEQGSDFEELYFVPNAYLQIGKVHQQLNQFDKAEKYYQLVLEFENHTYKQSLDLKASIALKELGLLND